MFLRRTFVLATLLALLPHSLHADGLPDLGEMSQMDLSPAMEQRIGETAMRDIRWNDPSYLDDPEVSAYVGKLGTRLAVALPEGRAHAFRFFVMRDSSLNAFAMPGGFIGVHSGTILASRSESELAGVLAHEVSHVTQHHIARMVGKQKESSLITLASVLVAVLAARSNGQVSQAAMAGGMAASAQTQLNYSRDFEREADRLGLQRLDAAGFDVRGMSGFFERLQRESRLYQNNAPAYLLSHPLTTERIADMEGRIQQLRPHATANSLDYQLVQAKLRVLENTPAEALAFFQSELSNKKYTTTEVAAHYGLARALLADNRPSAAGVELNTLRQAKIQTPMLETLAAEIKWAERDWNAALNLYRKGLERYPHDAGLVMGYAEALLAQRDARTAAQLMEQELLHRPGDVELFALQARAYGALGLRLRQHRAQAELYLQQGRVRDAIEQLELAQQAGDGDFYELSSVDARLRELKKRDDAKNRPNQNF